ncbi:MAG: RagB/SusD family nutrient uptake outer membrane protein [Chitinophagaceae bacterium]
MKKYLAIFAICTIATSCGKELLTETPKVPTGTAFYGNSNDLALASTGLYALNNVAFNQVAGFATCYGSDDAGVARIGNKLSFSDFDTFQPNSSNDRMTNWWSSFYATIKSSNSMILNYDKATATADEKNRAAGQAYFLRALSYFFLTRTWGGIPLTTDNNVDYSRPKATPAEIYTLIVADLQKAETMLPDSWSGLGVQFQSGVNVAPTKGSAKALLANVYLTMGGWPLKQNDKYALAAAKAKEVIDNKTKYSVALNPSFSNLWKKEYQYNNEAVFACYYNNNVPNTPWNQWNMMGPNSSQPGDENGWDDWFGEITFYNNFPAGARKDATYQSVYIVNGAAKAWPQTALKHPYFQKYRDDASYDPVTHVGNWAGDHTVYIIRYSEVLLTYAEAQARAGAPDASAYSAINLVRQRAGLGDLVAGLGQKAFADSVVAERGWEFAGLEPAARWFDLLRTETVGKANSVRNAGEDLLKGIPDDATHTFYWAPIPINDQQLNPNLH